MRTVFYIEHLGKYLRRWTNIELFRAHRGFFVKGSGIKESISSVVIIVKTGH